MSKMALKMPKNSKKGLKTLKKCLKKQEAEDGNECLVPGVQGGGL